MNNIFKILISVILLSLTTSVFSQYNPPTFEHITEKDGLPDYSVTCILQDYLGYLWFGTANGLVKYDGYSMKVFQPEKNESGCISDRGIVTIYEDKDKTLWIGTLNGLNKFNRANEEFKIYRYNSNDANTINNNHILCLYEDKKGRFWIGTSKGLNLFDRNKEIFTRYYFSEGNSVSQNVLISDKHNLCITCIIEDPISGELLLGTDRDGLWRFNLINKEFSKYKFNENKNYDEKLGWIQSFCKSRDGKIWIASNNTLSWLDPREKIFKCCIEFSIKPNQRYTKGFHYGSVIQDRDGLIWCVFFSGEQGVLCFNPFTEKTLKFNLFPDMPKEAFYNDLYTIYEDHTGIIWIGAWGDGLMKLDKGKNQFQVLNSDPQNFSNCLSHSEIFSIVYDPKGFIWFCTRRALDKYDIKTGTFRHYLENEKCITQYFYSAIMDKSGYLWLATLQCGLIRFNPINASYRFYFNDPKEAINLAYKNLGTLFQDHLGNLWMVTGAANFGLFKVDIANNKLTNYRHIANDPASLSDNNVLTVFEDSFGTIWVGSAKGLDKFDRKTEKFSFYGFNSVSEIYEDKQKNFWVDDYPSGLNLFDRENGVITATYSQKDGLISNQNVRIFEDDNNNLWIATGYGYSKFNIKTRTFKNYYEKDGLSIRSNVQTCGIKELDGKMYINNLVFYPDSITDDQTPPQVVLSNISLFNRPDEKLNYNGFISELKEITLPYDQNDLRFDFVGLHFSVPSENKYKYILEKFDDDWVNAKYQRNATYTNLDPGEYVFKVTASNKDGVWNETGASIKIIILPPWWKTWWAYALYTFVVILIFFTSTRFYLNRQRLKQSLVLESEHAEKLEEVARLKSNFFTNISHEFRTPLTLILGPAKQLKERITDNRSREELDLIHRSAKKLNRLVDELLDISKIESGEMKLKACPLNLVKTVKESALSFYSLAERKNIVFNFIPEEEEIITYIDKDKFEKILSNVLSNAFKFTPEEGKIELRIVKNINDVQILVSDTGIGIPKDQFEKIFDRFYQVNGSHTRAQEGTGIGLALTKELIDLHKGKIEVESEESKGSTFKLIFPLGKNHLKPEEICEEEDNREYDKDIGGDREKAGYEVDEFVKGQEKQFLNVESLQIESKPPLLIVEDNSDVKKYISMILENIYQIFEAKDGEEGLSKSFEIIPELIITDIMMPRLDGFQLCKKLKTDSRTSHIPVIMLTAKATMNDKLNGLEIGADDYIMKPFEAEELKARIKNLIDQRKRLHEHFRKHGIFEIEEKNITSLDRDFIKKSFELINNNLSNTSLGIEFLTTKLAVSKSVLNKKISALTGDTPAELIKRIRLTKAAKLIENNTGNISEIALEVGFSNPAYFSECFKKQFGVNPSQYHSYSRNT